MNVRVDLQEPIRDGMEVVFKAPCDASVVTGLNVYYPVDGVVLSQAFTFADANTNDIGHLNALFAKDAVVKVILDLDGNMAFVQNADTNAYLEGRFAELEAMIGTGGGTSELLIVTIDENLYASHTSSQIQAAVIRGAQVWLYAGSAYHALLFCNSEKALFGEHNNGEDFSAYEIYANGEMISYQYGITEDRVLELIEEAFAAIPNGDEVSY